jgi:hypothetical protein
MQQHPTTELDHLLDQFATAIPQFEKTNLAISNSNIGWHIDHSLLVISGIIDTTAKSDPKNYRWSFNFKRLIVMGRNKIPRGKAKAPKSVQPKNDYTLESLQEKLLKTRSKISELQLLSKDHYFEHPGLGNMKLNQTIRFLSIHTRHHLKIIQDIEGKK